MCLMNFYSFSQVLWISAFFVKNFNSLHRLVLSVAFSRDEGHLRKNIRGQTNSGTLKGHFPGVCNRETAQTRHSTSAFNPGQALVSTKLTALLLRGTTDSVPPVTKT